MVYEMAKGAPPHSDLRDAIKVMQLISKVKPPRLGEGDGSKDMRDFVSHCLRESPNDRLSADELAKTKWIKSAAKVNLSVLRELILRYDAWIQSGGSRASLAEPLDWESEEMKDLQKITEEKDELWEFDTVRRNSLRNALNEDGDVESPNPVDIPSLAPTIRPAPTRLPTSLRGLFDDGTTTNDTLKPSFPYPLPTTTTPTITPPTVHRSSSPAREPASTKKVGLPEVVDDVQFAKYNEFSFPSLRPRRSQDIIPSLPATRFPPSSPSPISRARSSDAANAEYSPVESSPSRVPLARKPSLIRQASVAVMESTPTSPLMPPVRPFAARERSGSSSSKGSDGTSSSKSLILPGLKDAVKVPFLTSEHQMGMTDLLPSSPSAMMSSSQPNIHSPTPLGSHNLGFRADANASTTSLPNTRSCSPSRSDRRGKSSFSKFSHATSLSLTSVPVESTLGPPIQPLDFASLTESQEATNSCLARTVDDLTRWFSVIEVGFASILEQSGGDAIAEEQEETPTERASFNAIGDAESNVHIQARHVIAAELP